MDIRKNELLKLAGKSQKGKNRIREQGELWELIKQVDRVQFSNQAGPWLLIQSKSNSKHERWIHAETDTDFSIVQAINETIA